MKRSATTRVDFHRAKYAFSPAAVLAAFLALIFAVALVAIPAGAQAESKSNASGQAANADVLNKIRKRLMNVRPDL